MNENHHHHCRHRGISRQTPFLLLVVFVVSTMIRTPFMNGRRDLRIAEEGNHRNENCVNRTTIIAQVGDADRKCEAFTNWINVSATSTHQNVFNATKSKSDEETFSSKLAVPLRRLPKVLPDRLITVVGLESSGTTFMAQTLGQALKLHLRSPIREVTADGMTFNFMGTNTLQWAQVQHLSLPWGDFCDTNTTFGTTVVDVVLPQPCLSLWQQRLERHYLQQHEISEWQAACASFLDQAVYRTDTNGATQGHLHVHGRRTNARYANVVPLPPRWFVDLSSHLDWYARHNVHAQAVIVLRDKTIGSAARHSVHCRNATRLNIEERLGYSIIRNALRRGSSGKPDNGRNATGPAFRSASSQQQQQLVSPRRRLRESNGLLSSPDGTVVVVSYEMLMQLRDEYLQRIYRYLGLQSDFSPLWQDGNRKYVNATVIPRRTVNATLVEIAANSSMLESNNTSLPGLSRENVSKAH